MDPHFGARLRAHRERQQISLPTIATQMKIRLSLLEQLESDQLAYWPKGIFGRSYLRDYARAIGLEPEAVVREFRELCPDEPLDPFSANGHAAEEAELTNQAPAARLRRLVSAAISAVPRRPREESTPQSPPEPAFSFPAPPRTPSRSADYPIDHAPIVPAAPAPSPDTQGGERRRGRDRRELSIHAAAELCSKLARALDLRDVTALLADAARLLEAVGIVVWFWDSRSAALIPTVAHGYSAAVLASLPPVRLDEANAIAAAFRSGEPSTVDGSGDVTGAVVAPSMGPNGCVGVLAVEVRNGREQDDAVRAFAIILAAQLGTLQPSTPDAESPNA
jgi:transcriptional regulator with XRE-family HTH domain